ncbi:MAG TPA: hypothetical protein VFV13_04235 [Acidimicrobiia bacterium]|nr:hypothetical protein [Acidimicrobiia bacterium]
MTAPRAAAIATWAYAAGFGISAIPVAIFLARRGRLPNFLGLFESYGGRWSARFPDGAFIALLLAFFIVTGVAAWSAWLLWNGSRTGAVINLILLPVEAIFWIGFALPIPWVFGMARVVLVLAGWSSLAKA